MLNGDKIQYDLFVANKELQYNLKNWNSPTNRIINWLWTGDPYDDSWSDHKSKGQNNGNYQELNK